MGKDYRGVMLLSTTSQEMLSLHRERQLLHRSDMGDWQLVHLPTMMLSILLGTKMIFFVALPSVNLAMPGTAHAAWTAPCWSMSAGTCTVPRILPLTTQHRASASWQQQMQQACRQRQMQQMKPHLNWQFNRIFHQKRFIVPWPGLISQRAGVPQHLQGSDVAIKIWQLVKSLHQSTPT